MTGRVCPKHEEYCPDGVCRWCEPVARDGTKFVGDGSMLPAPRAWFSLDVPLIERLAQTHPPLEDLPYDPTKTPIGKPVTYDAMVEMYAELLGPPPLPDPKKRKGDP